MQNRSKLPSGFISIIIVVHKQQLIKSYIHVPVLYIYIKRTLVTLKPRRSCWTHAFVATVSECTLCRARTGGLHCEYLRIAHGHSQLVYDRSAWYITHAQLGACVRYARIAWCMRSFRTHSSVHAFVTHAQLGACVHNARSITIFNCYINSMFISESNMLPIKNQFLYIHVFFNSLF